LIGVREDGTAAVDVIAGQPGGRFRRKAAGCNVFGGGTGDGEVKAKEVPRELGDAIN
jgi:hypothetical protein